MIVQAVVLQTCQRTTRILQNIAVLGNNTRVVFRPRWQLASRPDRHRRSCPSSSTHPSSDSAQFFRMAEQYTCTPPRRHSGTWCAASSTRVLQSAACGAEMKPNNATGATLYFLAGLACTGENFLIKAEPAASRSSASPTRCPRRGRRHWASRARATAPSRARRGTSARTPASTLTPPRTTGRRTTTCSTTT
jgi:hypothetical protein